MGNFGALLRRLRIAANLSQEALAEKANISSGAIGAYERGLRSAPHRDSVARLGAALGISGEALEEFEASARRKSHARIPASGAQTEAARTGNLPFEATSFVARESETAEIAELLRRHRVVTIIGAGGIGKTRVALQVAACMGPPPRDGAWIVDLSSVRDAALLHSKVAAVLADPSAATVLVDESLVQRFESKQMLLLLDNCEHLVEPVGEFIANIVRRCPGITFLVTSRERLRLTSETVYRLSSLAVPAGNPKSAIEASRYAAIELFVDRARSADQHFRLTDGRAFRAAEICRRLDGLPLAIELAAARLPALGLTSLSERLTDSIAALSLGARDLPARQRTLAATIEWSYSLLDERERLLFQRLSIFHGGCTLEGVEAVCSDGQLPAALVCDCLSSLTEKSLVAMDGSEDRGRYTLLQTTRAYASRTLSEAGDQAALFRRYAQWWARFADRAEGLVFDMSAQDWVSWVYPELENIDHAVAWATGPGGDDAIAARILSSLPLWTHLRRFAGDGGTKK